MSFWEFIPLGAFAVVCFFLVRWLPENRGLGG